MADINKEDEYLENCCKKYSNRVLKINALTVKIQELQKERSLLKEKNAKLMKNIQAYGSTQKLEERLEKKNRAARKAREYYQKLLEQEGIQR